LRWTQLCAGLLAGALALGASAAPAAATNFPKGPVRLIVPFPAGGPTDTVARLLAAKLQDTWHQNVIVDYKPGAGTIIGADYVSKAQPDGQTIGLVNSSFAVNPSLHTKMPYNTLKDLKGVTQLFDMQLAIVARPDAPFNNLKEMIAYAKAHPGKLNYSTPGIGSSTHLAAELLKREAGFDMQLVPMNGSAPVHNELMAGRLDVAVDPLLSVQPFVEAKKMKMIATMGAHRVAGTNYPIVAEVIPGFDVSALLGLIAPAGTPDAVVHKIAADTARALAAPDMKKRAADFGMEPVGSTPEQFQAFLASEMKRWGKVVNDAHIHAD
jgi:tripartite-type tricarboxylate transporter receptor subunit TctC